MNEKIDSEVFEQIKEIFIIGINASDSDEEIKMEMIKKGATLKNVARIFNQLMIDEGYVKTKDEKNTILDEVLVGIDLTDCDLFNDSLDDLERKLGVDRRSVSGSLRQWCKKNKVDFFKAQRTTGSGRHKITKNIYNWIVKNPFSNNDELDSYIKEIGTANTLNHAKHYHGILDVARRSILGSVRIND
jgi:hypothetical protein